MEKRTLGRTGYEVTAMGFGGMELHFLNEESAVRLLNRALDLGINYIDTSPEYAMSEYYIGKAIVGRRDEFILATKCGDNMTGQGALYRFDKETILSNVEESLRLMKTDYIDVLQLHGVIPEYFPDGSFEEVLDTLREIKKSGKVRCMGLTVCNKQEGMYGYPAGYGYNSVLRFAPYEEIDVIQMVYGGLTRLSEDVIQEAYIRYGTGIVARGIVKKYDPTYTERIAVAKLSELCEEGETVNDFLIRYAITHPGLSSVVVGTKDISHLEHNVRLAEKGKLSDTIYQEAKRRLNFAGAIPGPVDMAWI